jgi:hypothetical protein
MDKKPGGIGLSYESQINDGKRLLVFNFKFDERISHPRNYH